MSDAQKRKNPDAEAGPSSGPKKPRGTGGGGWEDELEALQYVSLFFSVFSRCENHPKQRFIFLLVAIAAL